ncbi:IS200/IS605 family transposase [Pseudonocardia alaniniphila]
MFSERHRTRLEKITRAVCDNLEIELVEFTGLVNFPPKVAISKLVNSLKGVSSRRLRHEFPDLARHYWRAQRLWSSLSGAPPSILRHYIEQQHHPLSGTLARCANPPRPPSPPH